jgi:hypothetical protein
MAGCCQAQARVGFRGYRRGTAPLINNAYSSIAGYADRNGTQSRLADLALKCAGRGSLRLERSLTPVFRSDFHLNSCQAEISNAFATLGFEVPTKLN